MFLLLLPVYGFFVCLFAFLFLKHKSVFMESTAIWAQTPHKLLRVRGFIIKTFDALSTYERGHYLWWQPTLTTFTFRNKPFA